MEDNQTLANELKTIAKSARPGDWANAAEELKNAFNGMIFLLREKEFVFSFVALCQSLKHHRRYDAQSDDTFNQLQQLCTRLQADASKMKLSVIGDQVSTIKNLTAVFKKLSGEDKNIITILNQVQQEQEDITERVYDYYKENNTLKHQSTKMLE